MHHEFMARLFPPLEVKGGDAFDYDRPEMEKAIREGRAITWRKVGQGRYWLEPVSGPVDAGKALEGGRGL
jgi:hypothetical protein